MSHTHHTIARAARAMVSASIRGQAKPPKPEAIHVLTKRTRRALKRWLRGMDHRSRGKALRGLRHRVRMARARWVAGEVSVGVAFAREVGR